MIEIDEKRANAFWHKVDKSGGCWVWTGTRSASGYGLFSVEGRMRLAHRVSLHMALPDVDVLGVKPQGVSPMYVLHSCDNPACVNPEHLRLGTPTENADDMVLRKRKRRRITSEFTREQILEIRETGKSWDGLCDMMKKYRVSQNCIEGIVERKTNKWVDEDTTGYLIIPYARERLYRAKRKYGKWLGALEKGQSDE